MFKENAEHILRWTTEIVQNYVNGVGPMFRSLYEGKNGEG